MNTRIVFVGVMVGLITTASLIYRFSTNSQDGIQIIGIVDANEVGAQVVNTDGVLVEILAGKSSGRVPPRTPT